MVVIKEMYIVIMKIIPIQKAKQARLLVGQTRGVRDSSSVSNLSGHVLWR